MARKHGKDRGILQRKGREGWWVRIVHNGRERWHKCDTKSQAKALYGRLKAEIREGKYFPEKFTQSQEITLRAWITRYLEGSSNQSIINERRYGRFWSLLLGKRLMSAISTEDLRRIQTRMKAKHDESKARETRQANSEPTKKKVKREKSPSTINRHFAFLRHVLTLAVKDGKLSRNPSSGIKFFPEARRTRFLFDPELTSLKGIMAPSDWKLVAFAVETGLRQAEQFELRWDQVSLETSTLTLPLPKGGKTRHVPLSEGAKDILRSLDSFLRSPWVFPSPKAPLKAHNPDSFINHVYAPALKKAGITGACWHTLRHTAASRPIMAGVDLFSVKEFLGHRDIQTTMRYAHLAPGHLQEAVNRGSLVGTVTATVTEKQPAVSA
jgi:integrase